MGFYGPEPFDSATAVYIPPPPVPPTEPLQLDGRVIVTVKGCAPKFTSGIQLIGYGEPLASVHVMGWTGPLAEGCTDYTVSHTFPSRYVRSITVVGSNKAENVRVEIILAEDTDSAVKTAFAG
jgi:hypothetical protein